MIMNHGYNFQQQLQVTNLVVKKKKKTGLSLYASKNRRKVKKKNGKRIGRPHTLKFPRLTKDHDITFGYEEEEEEMLETDDEQDMSLGEESYQFRVVSGASCQGVENMDGPPSSPSSSLSPSSPPSSSPSPSSSDSKSDDDDDFWNRPYIRYCCRQLKNDDFVRNLVQKLYRTQCLQDFILLVTQLADGSLSPLNIAFLLCLERAKWQSLKSTTQKILASGLPSPQREGSAIFFWTQKLWASHK